jgi:PPE-repeat protein
LNAITAHEKRLATVARSARAAILVPVLFALALLAIKQPEMAGFAVFGTFAHQVLVNYDTAGTARFTQSAMLTLLGAIAVSLGTLASQDDWLAVTGAFGVGVLSELPLLASGRIAAIRGALLLSFMLAVAVPAPGRSVFPYLAGWLMAGVIAQPALLLIWSTAADASARSCRQTGKLAAGSDHLNSIANGVRAGLALGLAVLFTRLFKVEHAFWVVLGVLPVLSANGGLAARTFWQEQRGTLIGFLVSAIVVAIIGSHHAWYWLILPFIVFGSAYAASALGLMVSQAAFTVFAVVLFSILLPQHTQSGIIRLEDIALGGAVSFFVSALLRLGTSHSACRGEAPPRPFPACGPVAPG